MAKFLLMYTWPLLAEGWAAGRRPARYQALASRRWPSRPRKEEWAWLSVGGGLRCWVVQEDRSENQTPTHNKHCEPPCTSLPPTLGAHTHFSPPAYRPLSRSRTYLETNAADYIRTVGSFEITREPKFLLAVGSAALVAACTGNIVGLRRRMPIQKAGCGRGYPESLFLVWYGFLGSATYSKTTSEACSDYEHGKKLPGLCTSGVCG